MLARVPLKADPTLVSWFKVMSQYQGNCVSDTKGNPEESPSTEFPLDVVVKVNEGGTTLEVHP